MVGDIVTVAGGKGGIGKTTTAINAGVALQEAGHETVVVDADLGMTNLGKILDLDHQPRLHHVLAGEAEMSEAITDGPEGLSILAGHESLEAFAHGDPSNLRPVLHSLARNYDVVLVDTGAGVSQETMIPMDASDGVLLVTTPKSVSIVDARKMSELAERVETDVVGAVVTKADKDTAVSAVADELDEEILSVVPQDDVAAAEEPLVVTASESYAAQAYRRLAMKLTDYVGTPVKQTAES
ncbi:MinD/ParA family protein [Halorientalis brevis]|uniref:MinD/ParA family protein n=1 Tax=Halorientalis brevis TaxID=1126241 RepID=A0ABD6C8L2_9EURY|nr:AAA family ATPase [Halorientalis brevis]